MFTGIIEELGEVIAVERAEDSARITIRGPLVCSDAQGGASIAVNGVCLTVVDQPTSDQFTADVMAITLECTGLGGLQVGDRVNLERPVAGHGRLGGHIVQGHVDGTGTVLRREPSDAWELVTISAGPELLKYLVAKGSITVDGISLTVAHLHKDSFTVSLIPETLERTTLGFRQPTEVVNLEVDVLAKYIERFAAPLLQKWHADANSSSNPTAAEALR